MEQKLIVKKVK